MRPRPLSAILGALALVVSLTVMPHDQVAPGLHLYRSDSDQFWSDDFDTDLGNWTQFGGGNWSLANGSLVIDNIGGMRANINATLDKFVYIVNGQFNQSFYLTFRQESTDQWNNTCTVVLSSDGPSQVWDNLTEQLIDLSITPGLDQTITIVGDGSQITVYVDEDSANGTCRPGSGSVGLGSSQWPATSLVDQVRLEFNTTDYAPSGNNASVPQDSSNQTISEPEDNNTVQEEENNTALAVTRDSTPGVGLIGILLAMVLAIPISGVWRGRS